MVNGYKLRNCNHTYCKDCLRALFENKISEADVLAIKCPDPTCDAEIAVKDAKELINSNSFEKYQQFLFLASLRVEPSPRCSEGTVADPSSPHHPKLICEYCSAHFWYVLTSGTLALIGSLRSFLLEPVRDFNSRT